MTDGRRRATAGGALALALFAVMPAAAGDPGGADGPGSPTVDRVVRVPELVEASGLAASLRHPGVLWAHNDSGDAARLFALDRRGRAAATVRLSGVTTVDAEAVASLDVPRAGPVLLLADIGDNAAVRTGGAAGRRPALIVLPEPGALRDSAVRPSLILRLRYPDGPHDAESVLADPRDQRLYVVTKGLLGGTLYAVPADVWPGPDGATARSAAALRTSGETPRRDVRLRAVAPIPVPLATDGAVAADGSVLVRGYGTLSVFAPVERLAEDSPVRAEASTALPDQPQGESLAVEPGDPRTVLVGSEGRRQPVWRVPLPAATEGSGPGGASGTTSPAANPSTGTSPRSSAGSAKGSGQESAGTSPAPRSGRDVLPLAGGVLVASGVLAAAGWVLAGRRRRRSGR